MICNWFTIFYILRLLFEIIHSGRQCKISDEEERKLIKHLLYRADIGNGAYRDEIRYIIKDIYDSAEKIYGGESSKIVLFNP